MNSFFKKCAKTLNLSKSGSKDGDKVLVAAEMGHIDIVKELLEKGVDVNCSSPNGHLTSLHYATKNVHVEIINLLCKMEPTSIVKTGMERRRFIMWLILDIWKLQDYFYKMEQTSIAEMIKNGLHFTMLYKIIIYLSQDY